MDIRELEYNFDIKTIKKEVKEIVDNIKLHPHHYQISLKHTLDDSEDLFYQGCGSLKYSFAGNNVPTLRKVPLTQDKFVKLNEYLKGSYLEKVHDTILNDFNFGRFRIMGMTHKKCMSMHTDSSKRIHIPVETNENCLMIIDKQVYHMPSNGKAYLVDTTKPHTALNANHSFMRLHLLFDLY
jgi:hypothetical protein